MHQIEPIDVGFIDHPSGCGRAECALGDRRNAREMPVFIFRGGKSERLESSHSLLA